MSKFIHVKTTNDRPVSINVDAIEEFRPMHPTGTVITMRSNPDGCISVIESYVEVLSMVEE